MMRRGAMPSRQQSLALVAACYFCAMLDEVDDRGAVAPSPTEK